MPKDYANDAYFRNKHLSLRNIANDRYGTIIAMVRKYYAK